MVFPFIKRHARPPFSNNADGVLLFPELEEVLAINLKTAKLLGLTKADFRRTPSECGREFAPLILDRK